MRAFKVLSAILLVLVFVVGVETQEPTGASVGMSVTPDLAIPVGPKADYYQMGYGGRLSALFGLGQLTWIAPRLDISYNYIPLPTSVTASLSLIRASAGIQATMLFGERLGLFGYGTAGGYYGILSGPTTSSDMFVSVHGGGGVAFQLFNDVSLSVGAEYNSFLGTFDAFSVFLGVTTRLAGRGGGAVPFAEVTPFRPDNLPTTGFIQISEIELDTVFPVLRKYYDSHPIGRAAIANASEETLENVEIRVEPATYIDSTKLSARIDSLAPGAQEEVDLYVLFNEEILGVSEGAKVITDVNVSYRIGDREGADSETVTLETYDRNALQWDDDQKIAAFVTAKDDEIQRFAKNMASLAQDVRVDAVSSELQLSMLLYSAMIEQGLAYVVDPSSAYEDLSDNPMAIDFVQFPRQTLYVKAGDCDDLSATFCTLLEAVGVSTAFVTVPGHIYMAFRLEMDHNRATRTFSDPGDLILRDDGSVWIPVETTLLREGFLQAWAAGARQWRTYDPEGQAGFIPVSDAWSIYEPVAFSISQIELGMPQRDGVEARFAEDLDAFVTREVFPQEQAIRSRLESRPGDSRLMNSLGVLYARYGKYTEAQEQFEAVLDVRDYVPAMVNLANLHFVAGDYGRARRTYEQALDIEDANSAALLGLARAEHELENFGSARAAHEKLTAISPDLASQFAYLGSQGGTAETGRASEFARQRTGVLWEDEE